jgi:hypothetical protein
MISSTLHPPRPYQEFEPARTVPLDSGLATAQQIAFGAACLRGIMAPHLSLGGICRATIRASMRLKLSPRGPLRRVIRSVPTTRGGAARR